MQLRPQLLRKKKIPPRPDVLADFDAETAKQYGAACLAGVDEAGRGPLAGPVVACAAFVPPSAVPLLSGIRDSKLLSAGKRERFFYEMKSAGVCFRMGFSLAGEIDAINILQATFSAMRMAVAGLMKSEVRSASEAKSQSSDIRPLTSDLVSQPSVLSPDFIVLVDGPHKIPGLALRQLAVVDGDARSLCVACASVCAKVLRDRWMCVLDLKFPGYGFASHKGYGTAAHMKALELLGPSPVHRMSFAPVAAAQTGVTRHQVNTSQITRTPRHKFNSAQVSNIFRHTSSADLPKP
ncbi:MAG: ribonuclease HII [bacterium]